MNIYLISHTSEPPTSEGTSQKKEIIYSSIVRQDHDKNESSTATATTGKGALQKIENTHKKQIMSATKMSNDLKHLWRWRSRDHFPTKLYALLELASSRGLGSASDAIAWLPNGRAFQIVRVGAFVADVAPLFFRLTKVRSFHRQLNLWGFKR